MRAEPESRRAVPLAVSMGDPAGIGLEISLKAWGGRRERGLDPFVLFADLDALAERAHSLGLRVPILAIKELAEAAETFATALPVRPVPLPARPHPGVPDPANAPAVIAAIEEATQAVVCGQAAALITNPIAKHVLAQAGFAYPGHTDFLAALAERHCPGQRFRGVMMLAHRELRVVPLTVHCPLAQVPRSITRALIVDTVSIVHASLQRDFGVAVPRIAITGLNPHAGEAGALGREEIDVIAPAVAELRAKGFSVTGPHAADTLFHAAARHGYDAAIAMYHDQALIPFKTIAFEDGVNVTLGLPFVRTSPDHGTAFDIAAKGCASAQSFIQSLKLAAAIASARSKAASP